MINVSDYILVHGKNKREYDKNLELVLKRLHFKGVTLNKQKCQFNLYSIPFFLTCVQLIRGMGDPEKIRAIKNAEAPTSAEEVCSLLGTTNYISRFIPNYSTIVEPIHRLTSKNTSLVWESEQKEALTKLKKALISKYVMTITFNNEITTTPKHIANCFTIQFANTVKHATHKTNRSTNRATHTIQGYNITLTTTHVREAIKQSKNNNSQGPDKLNIRHLKHIGPLGLAFLTSMLKMAHNKTQHTTVTTLQTLNNTVANGFNQMAHPP